jgi:branched-chain amino acid transport system permease protein
MKANNKKDALLKFRKLRNFLRPLVGVLSVLFIAWRLYRVFIIQNSFGPETWTRLLIAGLVIGSVYSLIAIGYTLVYGILLMINFAHGEVMMLGAFAGFFVFEAANAISVSGSNGAEISFTNAYPALTILVAFLVGMSFSALIGYYLEKIAYRPLRKAPRLIPLISAIGASFALQNTALLLFSPQTRNYHNPEIMTRGTGWQFLVNETSVTLPYTGVFTMVLSIILMVGLLLLVKKTRLGKSMRAVAMDKDTAALMGIDVDRTISNTFVISGALAGAAGVMWGLHNGLVFYFVGFLPGIKAFTAAVLGGIGNVPGAMLGGMFLGLVESLGPAALDISFQLKDVIAFVIMIMILVFKPSGILGELLSEEKI